MSEKNYENEVAEATKDLDFENKSYRILLETSMGNISLDLLPEVAPGHCRNMIGLAKVGFYDSLIFHRVIDGFMVQGGCPEGSGTGGPGYQVEAEFNETRHEAGVLSMARAQDPNSAGSQFFICVADASFLDRQYSAFGKTSDEASTEIVQRIGKVSTGANDRPAEDITILKATVEESAR